jgi:hypothetical protein
MINTQYLKHLSPLIMMYSKFHKHPLKTNMNHATAAAARARGGPLSENEEKQLQYAEMQIDFSNYRDSPGDKVKDPHKIIPLLKPDGTPFSWAFLGFFDVKEWIKSFCNRTGSMTTLGDKNFMPFNNLSVRWVQNSLVDDKLWVIRIDATMSATEGSFPMLCHVPWANKIARVVLSSNVQWEAGSLEVLRPLLLTEAQTDDLESKFRSTPAIPVAIDEELLMELGLSGLLTKNS